MNEKNPTPTKLEKARAKVEAIQREKEIDEHRLVRAKNRLQNTLKKRGSRAGVCIRWHRRSATEHFPYFYGRTLPP